MCSKAHARVRLLGCRKLHDYAYAAGMQRGSVGPLLEVPFQGLIAISVRQRAVAYVLRSAYKRAALLEQVVQLACLAGWTTCACLARLGPCICTPTLPCLFVRSRAHVLAYSPTVVAHVAGWAIISEAH